MPAPLILLHGWQNCKGSKAEHAADTRDERGRCDANATNPFLIRLLAAAVLAEEPLALPGARHHDAQRCSSNTLAHTITHTHSFFVLAKDDSGLRQLRRKVRGGCRAAAMQQVAQRKMPFKKQE
jgi:hypothetical protein